MASPNPSIERTSQGRSRPLRRRSCRTLGNMQTRTESDWGEIDLRNLDALTAREHFMGRSLAEAGALFIENAFVFQEDLFSMPRIPFNFYAPVFSSYVVSPAAYGNADGGSSYLAFVEELLGRQPDLVQKETLRLLLETAERVAQNQAFYEADPSIYGSFAERHQSVQRLARQTGVK